MEYKNLTSVRVGEISLLLTEATPSLIPFKGDFPLVPQLEYKVFLEEISKSDYFDELPKFLKEIVLKAEQIKMYDDSFKAYLKDMDISKKEFKSKNPVTKLDILYDWLFSNQLDIGILDL